MAQPMLRITSCLFGILTFLLAVALAGPDDLDHIQGEMAGEVSEQSVILQSRLTASSVDDNGDVPGRRGVARFEIADNPGFQGSTFSSWLEASPASDFIVKKKIEALSPATRYYYRLEYGRNRNKTRKGPTRTFRTNSGAERADSTSLVVVTGMNYAFFQNGPRGDGVRAYTEPDKGLGYPALESILNLSPDYFIGTGDNVYYDHPADSAATTPEAMRKKWHEQFVQPRFVELFAQVATYWEKDDHDHRYNDNDNTGDRPPSSELGIRIFREQVPVVDPEEPEAVTYRTYRLSQDLQIWLLEGRDYRSPNRMEDGPEKTLWGIEQRKWLQRTLLESNATFKLIISPTPLVGPDDRSKRDNHTNVGGFRHEGEAFFSWAHSQGFLDKGLYFVCGDRHWQYHSIHPSGFEEFSTGALVDANSRLGVDPGDPDGTDPEGFIEQPYTSIEPSGGFLNVRVIPETHGAARAEFRFFDENGDLLHSVEKRR